MFYDIDEKPASEDTNFDPAVVCGLPKDAIVGEIKKTPHTPAFQREILLNENLQYHNDYIKKWVESREKYAVKAERIATRWLAFVMVIIVGEILSNVFLNKPLLTSQVLIALIAGGTVTIVGLFHTVLKGIFPAK